MAKKKLSVGISLMENDEEIIAWLNMLKKEGLKPRTWVQAVLLAELADIPLDAGGVYIPPKTKPKTKSGSILFGDDTTETKPKVEKASWGIKGDDGEFVVGSMLVIVISRAVILEALESANKSKKSTYIKAVLRKHIRKLDTPPNEPPENINVDDLFVLYEGCFKKPEHTPVPVVTPPVIQPVSTVSALTLPVSTDPPVDLSNSSIETVGQQPKIQAPELPVTKSLQKKKGFKSPEEKKKKNPLLDYIS